MSGSSDYHRNSNDGNVENDFDYIISSDMPIGHALELLKLKKMSENEIEETLDKIRNAREKIKKVVRKFLGKLNTTYGHLDIPELIRKGMKHANKYGLTDVQKKVFINHVLKGDIYNKYSYLGETKRTRMAKFLGFNIRSGQMLNLDAKDYSKLNELHALYESSRRIHQDVKNQVYRYRDCAAEAINGSYDRNRHIASVHVHPVLAALFLPKIEYIEQRMLYTNIGRMVLSRGQIYLKKYNFRLHSNTGPGELDAELELANDIAQDPNSLAHFNDEAPIDNLIKRFRCQIALYRTVLQFRQGRYYSTGYDENDGISGFIRLIDSYNWSFFDSPDMIHANDEGTILRKLLAIFSCRPTFTQLSSFTQRFGMGFTGIGGMSKVTYVNIPVVNIKLPIDLVGNRTAVVSLQNALTQVDFFVEHRTIVPKNKSVIYSNSVAFFYANRRNASIRFTASCEGNIAIAPYNMPTSITNTTVINNTRINFEPTIAIGRTNFEIKSIVILQRPPIAGMDIAVGCAALVKTDRTNGRVPSGIEHFHYNPGIAAIQFDPQDGVVRNDPQTGIFVSTRPITYCDESPANLDEIGFRTEGQDRGTIFVYVREE